MTASTYFSLPRGIPGLLKSVFLSAALVFTATSAHATELTLHLAGNGTLSRKTVEYSCDAAGEKIGVPAGPFSVEYINGGGNSLVIVPVSGNSLIFANVMSGSGARYTAQALTWWDAHGGVTLTSDSLAGKSQSTCKVVKN